jgi:curli biogenesis system outer membrane secretion channel CsgG
MNSRVERGERLREWAAVRGRKQQLSEISGVSTSSIDNAFAGTAGEKTYDKLEAAMRYIDEHPEDAVAGADYVARSATGQIIEFEVQADAVGVRVFVRGPIENSDELSTQVAKVLREIGSKDLGTSD